MQTLALMHEQIGEYEKASEVIATAVELEPYNERFISDLKHIKSQLSQNDQPLCDKSDPIWQCDELLAEGESKRALALLRGYSDDKSSLVKARCYGAMLDVSSYLNEWKLLKKGTSKVELKYSDWFYMPDSVFNAPEIWHVLKELMYRIEPSVFPVHDSFYEEDSMNILDSSEIQMLMTDFYIARTENDLKKLSALQETYPAWSEIRF